MRITELGYPPGLESRALDPLGTVLLIRVLALAALLISVAPTASAADGEPAYAFHAVDLPGFRAIRSANRIIQDDHGFVWVATELGLLRMDGAQVDQIPLGLPDGAAPEVESLFQDRDGNLWVGTFGAGLVRLDGRTLQANAILPGPMGPLLHGEVSAIGQTGDGNIWIGTGAGLTGLDADGEVLRHIPLGEPDPVEVLSLVPDGTGGLWVGSRAGLWRLEEGADAPEQIRATLPDGGSLARTTIWDVMVDGEALWLATDLDGLMQLAGDGSVRQFVHDAADPDSLVNNTVYRLFRHSDGTFWVGTYRGMDVMLDGGRFLHHRRQAGISDSLISDTVYALMEDRSGILWVGTAGGGVAQHDPYSRLFRLYLPMPGYGGSGDFGDVISIAQADAQHVWIVALDSGLSLLNVDSGVVEYRVTYGDPPFGLRSDSVIGLANAARGGMWVGTVLGVEYLAEDRRVTPVTGLPEGEAWSVLEDADGGLWVGLYDLGLFHRAAGSDTFERYQHVEGDPTSLGDDRVYVLHQSRDGRIWVGTNGAGVSVFDPVSGNFDNYHFSATVADYALDRIYAISEDAAGTIWIGTGGGGLVRLDPRSGQRRIFTTADGLNDDLVVALQVDSEGIWATTFSGISRLRPGESEFQALPVGRGLVRNMFNEGGVLRMDGGRMLFGGRQGVIAFDPERIHFDPVAAVPQIVGVMVGNSNLRPRYLEPSSPLQAPPYLLEHLTLPRGTSSIQLDLAALHFSSPYLNRVRYMLEGVDEGWQEASAEQAHARYQDLAPGDYRFRLLAANPDGVWSEQEATLLLSVRPTIWQHPAMQVAYLLGAVLLLLLVLERRRRQLAGHREELSRMRIEQERLRLAMWGSDNFLWEWTMEDREIYSAGLLEYLGYAAGDGWIHRAFLEEHIPQEDLIALMEQARGLKKGDRQEVELAFRMRAADGETHWLTGKGRVVYDLHERPLRVAGAIKDVTASYATQADLRLAELAMETGLDAISVLDDRFNFVRVNRAFTEITGYASKEVIGRPSTILNSDRYPDSFAAGIRHAVEEWGSWSGELWERDKFGDEFLSWLRISRVSDDRTGQTLFVAVFTDVTQRFRTEEELRFLASYDALTGLPNRSLLMDRLSQAMGRAERRDERLTLFRLDLDHFKDINDSGGQLQGDRALKMVADALAERAGESGTAARMAADEFVLLLGTGLSEEQIPRFLEDLAVTVAALPVSGNLPQRLSFCCGVARFPEDAKDADQLLQRADLALQQAKRDRAGAGRLYRHEMDEGQRERVALAAALTRAMEGDDLELHFQPKVDGRTHEVTGMEALLRWRDEEKGLIPPSYFIPLAEERGLINELGRRALRDVCRTIRRLREQGVTLVPVAVNLSTLQADDASLPRFVSSLLEEFDVPASLLRFEITESSLMSATGDGLRVLEALRDMGIKLDVDDFGTGYSSLNYLRRLPVDGIKVDRTFIQDLGEDPFAEGIIRAIVAMAQTLGLAITAEGVETREQLEFMLELGCTEIQGYIFSRPLPYDELIAFLRRPQSGGAA